MNATNHAILQSLVSTAAAGPLGWGGLRKEILCRKGESCCPEVLSLQGLSQVATAPL
jgi:hypothetical protein